MTAKSRGPHRCSAHSEPSGPARLAQGNKEESRDYRAGRLGEGRRAAGVLHPWSFWADGVRVSARRRDPSDARSTDPRATLCDHRLCPAPAASPNPRRAVSELTDHWNPREEGRASAPKERPFYLELLTSGVVSQTVLLAGYFTTITTNRSLTLKRPSFAPGKFVQSRRHGTLHSWVVLGVVM